MVTLLFIAKQFRLVLLLFFALGAKAQNLVPNGDFEDVVSCPTTYAQLDELKSWESPTHASPDLFCTCAKLKQLVSVPLNFGGEQNPHSGNCYTGIVCIANGTPLTYSEYIAVKLNADLAKGKKYKVEFYYSLADFSDFTMKELGVLFYHEHVQVPDQEKIIQYDISLPVVNDMENWHLFSAAYTARGDEKYIIIGSFKTETGSNTPKPWPKELGAPNVGQYGYYYIDDVSMVEVNDDTQVIPIASYDLAVNKSMVLENVYFDTDKSDLLPASYTELNKLYEYLLNHPAYTIKLTGHTDNVGNAKRNLLLSENRAKAVAEYLVAKGIDAKRIQSAGYGSTKPVAPNDNETNRQLNRRVELEILK